MSIYDTLAVLIHVQLIYCYENKRGPHAVKPLRLVNFKLELSKNFLVVFVLTAKFDLVKF